MLACVCQPVDPGAFRRSPIPLGTPPLKITNRGAIPKPGRTIRLYPPITDAPSSAENDIKENTTGKTSTASVLISDNEKCTEGHSNCSRTCKFVHDIHKNNKVKGRTSPLKGHNIKSSDDSGYSSSKPKVGKSKGDKKHERKEIDFEKLPDGVQLTLSELREMACRQQAQIDSQHQLLAAKEQRLRYLKEHEARQQRVQAESERLRRLRDRVDAQELKLRKLRALRGQVDHQKQNNISLTSDLDSIRALFNEKEKELSMAVAKVEELTRQLEELRRGRSSSRDPPPASALELDKLRRELMKQFQNNEIFIQSPSALITDENIELERPLSSSSNAISSFDSETRKSKNVEVLENYRNKLNEQQNQRLHQQREALTARQEEMSAIDKRISELQERLHRKRLLNQQLANQISAASHKAAYHQLVRLTGNAEQNNQAFARKQQNNQQPNGLSRGNIAAVEPYNHVPLQTGHQIRAINNTQEHNAYHPVYQQNPHIKKDTDSPNSVNEKQELTNKMANLYTSRPEDNDALKEFTVSKSDPKYQTLPYNTKFTVNLLPNRVGKIENINNVNSVSDSKEQDMSSPSSTHVNGTVNIQSTHMTVHSAPLNAVNKNIATPLNQNDLISRKSNEVKDPTNLINGNVPNGDGGFQKPQNENAYPSSSNAATGYQKPVSSVAPTSIHHSGILSNVYQTSSIKVQPVEPQTISTSNNKQLTALSHSNQNSTVQSPQSIVLSPPESTSTPVTTPEVSGDKTPKPALPPKPAIKPPPRQTQAASEDGSPPPPLPLTEPPDDTSKSTPVLPKSQSKPGSLSQHFNKSYLPQPSASSNIQNSQPNAEMVIKAKPLTIKKQPLSEQPKLRSASSKSNGLAINRRIEMPPTFYFPELQNIDKVTENATNQIQQEKDPAKDETDKISFEDPPDINEQTKDEKPFDGVIRRCKKGNLKQTGKSNLSRRVSFDPLALLLDASLEGELELVKKTATQVPNPSAANDEGITALHNAICAGHLEIVKFLVEFGCDVNAQDSDGWTPLHCAASCNNVTMVKFLVEHGACIFATTLSDHETAAEKCEEDEEGFDGCSEYLYSVQEKLGILSGGVVYAVFDYTAQQPDELSFKAGQQFTVLRKGDENEREWWWSRLGDKEGYVPRNLLGLYPRVSRSED